MLDAIATEPGMLAVVHHRETSVLLPFMTPKTIAVRFSGTCGRDYTMQFLSVLPPNVMSKVGRVLADCDIAPYPHEEIEKALAWPRRQSKTAHPNARRSRANENFALPSALAAPDRRSHVAAGRSGPPPRGAD